MAWAPPDLLLTKSRYAPLGPPAAARQGAGRRTAPGPGRPHARGCGGPHGAHRCALAGGSGRGARARRHAADKRPGRGRQRADAASSTALLRQAENRGGSAVSSPGSAGIYLPAADNKTDIYLPAADNRIDIARLNNRGPSAGHSLRARCPDAQMPSSVRNSDTDVSFAMAACILRRSRRPGAWRRISPPTGQRTGPRAVPPC